MTPVPRPEDLWRGIQGALAAPADVRGAGATPRRTGVLRRPVRSPWLVAAAAVAALTVGTLAGAYRQFAAPAQWAVVALGGAPHVDGAVLVDKGALGAGEWLVTDATSSARLTVGRIGLAEIGPESRVRLVRGGLTDHRLVLERGSLHAVIGAPPRLFFVETPSALATDLGCAYTLEVDSLGASRLHVTAGWVELDQGGRRALVPAGMAAEVEKDRAPGTPYVAELSDGARAALRRLDGGTGHQADLEVVLAAMATPDAALVARQQSGITLWHLAQRVDGASRAQVVAALARLAPPPAEVTMEGILALDRRMLDRWRRDLSPMWGEEAAPLWATIGQRLWLWAME
ncbi:MAG: hypothetical protein WD771_07795 [Gemmatimonadaceae bacterium]